MIIVALMGANLLPGSPCSAASPPPGEPILCINTDMHTGSIRKIATDAANQYLVTGSTDRTVRLWNLRGGEHLKTFRPPWGEANEGKIYAVAMSPDGSTIACAGITGRQWDESWSIYFFDRASGRMVRRITGLPYTILDLAYSKDGRFLAVGMAKGHGVRLFDAIRHELLAQDDAYEGSCYNVDFDDLGRLVTASDSGWIRLYDERLQLVAKQPTSSGKAPFSVSFSPDGKQIAVGFLDSRKIDVLSGENLSMIFSPSIAGIDNGNLSSVTWSADGDMLCAAGRWGNKNGNLLRCWKNGGRGESRDIIASEQDTVLHLISLSQGGVAFCAGDPAFGVISSRADKLAFRGSPILNFQETQKDLLVSKDATVVQFGYFARGGKQSARFSVEDRTLRVNSGQDSALAAPISSSKEIKIGDWSNSEQPTVNKRKIVLDSHEHSWSAAIAPDGRSFLLGADWSLRHLGRNGEQLWKTTVSAVCRAVNVSGDGRLAVAAHGDGTIRWYRMRDGKEVLALFPHGDQQRWVLWTPTGYYDASIGADQIIGWHKNNGPDAAADFFPIAKFRSVYYRPDITRLVLQNMDEGRALQAAYDNWGRKSLDVAVDRMLPPVVEIMEPADNSGVESPEITLRFNTRSPSGEPVTAVKVLVDGRPVPLDRGGPVARADGSSEVTVTIPNQDCAISVIAQNKYSASDPATVKVKWRQASTSKALSATASPDEFIIKPKLYILAIGVSNYDKDELDLNLPSKDAGDFARVMERQGGGLYAAVAAKVLTDEQASKDNVLDGLDWIRKQTTDKDVALIFLAGHGMSDNRSGAYYFLPVNADPDKLMRTGVPFADIQTTVTSLPGKIILFIDACYSGNIMGGARSRGLPVGASNDLSGVVNELASAESGAIVFTSSSSAQKSFESDEWGNGAFTKALLEGLSGKADYQGRGKITVNMLDLYVSERVKELTKGEQTPTVAKPQTVRDYPIALANPSSLSNITPLEDLKKRLM